jgi:uncharacterized protein (TIGR03086 family)
VDQIATLEYAVDELRREVAALGAGDMQTVSNCEPWTVRQLASHALNNQLLWGGVVTGQSTVSVADTMGGVAHDGDLTEFADDVSHRSLAMWHTSGVLEAIHSTPFGDLPGSVVINFATIDALCHAWDLSASLGHPLEFAPDMIPEISEIVTATCTDAVRATGLIKGEATITADATETERLMAAAGRSFPR